MAMAKPTRVSQIEVMNADSIVVSDVVNLKS